MLDINLFRADKGGSPDLIRESQRTVELVDEVAALDKAWRQRQFELDKIRQELNAIKKRLAAKEAEVQEAKSTLDAKLTTIGNIVHAFSAPGDSRSETASLKIARD